MRDMRGGWEGKEPVLDVESGGRKEDPVK